MTQDVRSNPGGLQPGEQLAGYLIQEEIGRGGMAVVYRALDLRLDRLVALKVLAPHLGEDEAFRQRFMRESRAAAGVDHPHIIPVFEAGEAGGVLFIAMRYISRGDVRWLIRTEGKLTAARTLPIMGQIASALDAAHAYGLVHRDVKPGNILLGEADDQSDHAYLSDFGLSKHSLNTATLTAAGQFLGTLDYVSPEQIQGQPVDGRADQYALACTVMEMLTGAPPFHADDSMALMWAQLEAEPPRLTNLRPDLPPAVDYVIGAALAKTPAGRFASCREFAVAFSSACMPAFGSRQASRAPQIPAQRAQEEFGLAGEAGRLAEPQPDQRQPDQRYRDQRYPDPDHLYADQWYADPDHRQADQRLPGQRRPEAWPYGDGSERPGAGRPAVPPAADATGPAPGARPVPLTRWDGHVPVINDRPRSTVPDEREPPPGREPPGPPEPPGTSRGRSGSVQRAARSRWPGRILSRPGRSGHAGGRDSIAAQAAIIAVACAVILGAIAYKLADRHGPASPAAKSQSDGAGRADPAGTVEAYFAAINDHRFLRAWQLVGEHGSFRTFKAGFAGTAHDTVTILSVKGDVVTARLAAMQLDGTTKEYSGTYTVANGVIVASDIQQVSEPAAG